MKARTERDLLAESGERFAADVAGHQLTVLHDDGLYRHIRLARPSTHIGSFDIVTWPGHLAIGGDLDGYVFARIQDMFAFFRAASGWNSGTINPGYWAEKLVTDVKTKTYSEDKFREAVADDLAAAIESGTAPEGLAEAVQFEILDEYAADLETEDGARTAVRDFAHRYTVTVPGKEPGDEPRIEHRLWSFVDTFEWDLCEWDVHFLRACHAIQWGIEQYDRRPATAPMPKLLDSDGMVWTWHPAGYLREDDGETLTAERVKAEFEAVEVVEVPA